MKTNQENGSTEKESRTEIEKLRQDLNKEFDDKLKKRLNKNLKTEILVVVIAVMLTAAAQYYFSERNAIITSAYEFKDGEVILTLHNDAGFHSPSNIKIFGKVGDKEVLLKEITNHILSKDNDLEISIPVKSTTVKLQVKQNPSDEKGMLGGVTIPAAEINRVLESNHLAYKIDCDKCPKNGDWKVISIKKSYQYFTIQNIGGQLYFEVEAELYSWK
ncbi:MAG: hypothetical protein WA977_13515 [Halobacteriota archaeon]